MPDLEFAFKTVHLFKVNCHRFDDYYHLVGSFQIPVSIADSAIYDALKDDWIHEQTPPLANGDLIYIGEDGWGSVYTYTLTPGSDGPGMIPIYTWEMSNASNGLRESLGRIIGGVVQKEVEEEPISRRAQILRERAGEDVGEEKGEEPWEDPPLDDPPSYAVDNDLPF
jgi:hypothetical protein